MKRTSPCPLTESSRKRADAVKLTAPLQAAFPPGIAQPALRALAGAGLMQLSDLARITEADLAALHGMGPKAIGILRLSLKKRGLKFSR